MRDAGRDPRRGFTFDEESVALPPGAFAGTRRRLLRHDGRVVLGTTAGVHRPYLYPVMTPAGFAVTSEGPADHPHHHSVWVGADPVALAMPALGGRLEEHAYNLYVNDVFHGRAPGTIRQLDFAGRTAGDAFVLEQTLAWRGAIEWAAPDGKPLLAERRTTRVRIDGPAVVIDLVCVLAAVDFDITIGPTRHAFFNYRVAPSMCVDEGGVMTDDRGNRGNAAAMHPDARWIDTSGPVGGGHVAGIALGPRGDAPWWWFVSDWGVATASPCRDAPIRIARGAEHSLAARFVVHDGDASSVDLARLLA